jgi:hypothetical protein
MGVEYLGEPHQVLNRGDLREPTFMDDQGQLRLSDNFGMDGGQGIP